MPQWATMYANIFPYRWYNPSSIAIEWKERRYRSEQYRLHVQVCFTTPIQVEAFGWGWPSEQIAFSYFFKHQTAEFSERPSRIYAVLPNEFNGEGKVGPEADSIECCQCTWQHFLPAHIHNVRLALLICFQAPDIVQDGSYHTEKKTRIFREQNRNWSLSNLLSAFCWACWDITCNMNDYE